LFNVAGQECSTFSMGSDITIEMTFNVQDDTPIRKPIMGVVLNHLVRGTVGGVNMRMTGFQIDVTDYTFARMRCTLLHVPMLQGEYNLDIWLGDGETDVDVLTGYVNFTIEETDIYKTGKPPFNHMGAIYFEPSWEFSKD